MPTQGFGVVPRFAVQQVRHQHHRDLFHLRCCTLVHESVNPIEDVLETFLTLPLDCSRSYTDSIDGLTLQSVTCCSQVHIARTCLNACLILQDYAWAPQTGVNQVFFLSRAVGSWRANAIHVRWPQMWAPSTTELVESSHVEQFALGPFGPICTFRPVGAEKW